MQEENLACLTWEKGDLFDGDLLSCTQCAGGLDLDLATSPTSHAHPFLTFAVSKPSLNSMISQICSMSGTTMVTGRNRALRLSGSSVRPA